MQQNEFIDHCLDLLKPLGLPHAKRMFGGHGLYLDGLFIAIIADEQLFLKTDVPTRAAFEAAGCQPFTYLAQGKVMQMNYWSVPADAMECPAQMLPWARLALEAALRARAAKTPAPRRKRAVVRL
ncbi:MAG: TfoX/Sxy family protein [Burkholderiaceae bacterium]|nr:TfoX/Sxy family protein [Burkholderiaceae bacterium]